MFQAIAALAGAAATVAACYALGVLLMNFLRIKLCWAERLPLAFLLGAACLHLVVFTLLALKIASWPVVIGVLLAVFVGQAILPPVFFKRPEAGDEIACPTNTTSHLEGLRGFGGVKILSALLFVPFTVLAFFHAWAPESSADGSGYHLGLVARYLRAHGFERITTDLYASLSGGLELIFLPAFIIGRHSAAALVHLAFAIALALAMFAYGRRISKPWVGAAAAFLTFASPVVGIDASSAYNDVALAAVVFAVFYWLQIWDESRDDLVLISAGLLAGYAYTIKYTAFVMLPLALIFVAYRSRRWKPLVAVTICALAMAGPWMIKNWIYVSNPVAPFANQIFRNPYYHVSAEQALAVQMRSYNVDNKWTLPLEVTVRGEKTTGIIGPIFLAAPLVLLALREQAGRRLLAAGVLLLAPYFANVGTRFLIPCLPFFSLAMLLPLTNFPVALAAIMVFHAVASWPPIIAMYAPRLWRLDWVVYRQALRISPQDAYLRENYPPYGAARLVEASVPKGERVLAMNGVPDAYTSREVLVSFRAAFNETLADTVNIGWQDYSQPRVRLTFSFPERSVGRIRVLQTAVADPPAMWSVHELRFFDRGVELPRRPEWKLRAWPNPWDVQLAFDNSPATRWRTWEPARPGMYLDVDFAGMQAVDEVRVETSWEHFVFRPIVEVANDGGAWEQVAQVPVVKTIDPGPQIRRSATHEMAARGIHYLLIHDTDFGADDFRGDPEGWGLTQVAAGYGIAIYRVIP